MGIQQEFACAPKMVTRPVVGKERRFLGGGWHNENDTSRQSKSRLNTQMQPARRVANFTIRKYKEKRKTLILLSPRRSGMTLVILLVASFSFRRRSPRSLHFICIPAVCIRVRESRRVPIPLSRITAIYEDLKRYATSHCVRVMRFANAAWALAVCMNATRCVCISYVCAQALFNRRQGDFSASRRPIHVR